MINGVHLPNGPLQPADLALFASGAFTGALLLPEHGPEVLQQLRDVTPRDLHFVARLPDSTQPDGHVDSAGVYARRCASRINWLHPYGVRDFQVDNEPMHQAFWRPDKAWEWQAFMQDVLPALRLLIPPAVRLGLAPLVLPPEPADWDGKVASLRVWEAAASRLLGWVDFCAVHAYWQAAADMNNLELGLRYLAALRWAGKPVIITEYANSRNEIPGVTPAEVEAARVAQYPAWLQQASHSRNVEGAYCFILGGSDEWAGFRLTPAVVAALGGA